MTNIIEALVSLRPGIGWTVDGNTYAGIRDKDANTPTEQEVLDEITRLEALEVSETQRQEGLKASAYIATWDANLKGRSLTQIKNVFDNATAQQKSDLLFYLLLVRALDVRG